MEEEEVVINKIIVHAGTFHADDAMCVALIQCINPDVEVIRTFEVTEDMYQEDTIVADIGEGYYDHHQDDCERRKNGDKYAACGLVFRDFWDLIFPDKESALSFERNYIIPIELQDNGVETNTLSVAIKSFVPSWNSEESYDEAFIKAVSFLHQIVRNEVIRAEGNIEADDLVYEAFEQAEDKRIVVLEKFCPWQKILARSDALFCIFPSNRGGWNIQSVPSNEGHFSRKEYLPEWWETEMPEGCNFVHNGLFLASFDTKEHALKAAKTLV